MLICVRLFAIPCTLAAQAPLPLALSKQEYWSGVPFPFQGICPYTEKQISNDIIYI